MDFTREPVIETVITPKEGSKLVVRSSKGASHEEYFVDAVEMVSFGGSSFFRSLEKPKSFIVPVSDYEILEVRETRMVLKHATSERAIKISGTRGSKSSKKDESDAPEEKKRKRAPRRRRKVEPKEPEGSIEPEEKVDIPQPKKRGRKRAPTPTEKSGENSEEVPQELPNLLPPPPKLISETISKYREKFKTAFYGEGEIEQIADEGRASPHIPPAEEETGKWDFKEALTEASEEQPSK